MRIPLYISPCPNDTFIFHALIHGLVDTEGLDFEPHFCDIDQLNSLALSGVGGAVSDSCSSLSGVGDASVLPSVAVVKVSCAILGSLLGPNSGFALLPSGGAFGFGNGPLLVRAAGEGHDIGAGFGVSSSTSVAVPGYDTTANRLLSLFYPQITDRRACLFSDIARAVADCEVECGVLIHEGRFTYADHGLVLVEDFGARWETDYSGVPLPLGAIVCRDSEAGGTAGFANSQSALSDTVGRVVRRSVEYALAHPQASAEFVRAHARELSPDVLQKHISYFVNDYSIDMGPSGLRAISILCSGS